MTENNIANEKPRWLDKSENVRKLYLFVWAIGIVLLALDLVIHRHPEIQFDGWFGFYCFFGFFACVALVITAKGLRRILMRPEDYYDR